MNDGEHNEVARPRPRPPPSPNAYNNDSARASNYSESYPHVPSFLYRNSKSFSTPESAAALEIDAAWRSQIPNSVTEQRSTHSSLRHIPFSDSRPQSPLTNASLPQPIPTPMDSPRTKKSRACCCCCRSRTGALCCALVTVALVIGIALAAFFLWPRVPTVEFGSITQRGSTNSIESTSFGDLFQSSSNGYNTNVQINMKVTNNNYIDLIINQLDVKGSLQGGNNLRMNNFLTGKLPRSVNLKSLATSPFSIPVSLTLPTNDATQLAALGLVCSQQGQLTIPYTISLSLALVSWTGYKPTISDRFSFPCPWSIPSL